ADSEQVTTSPDNELVGVLRPDAGTAPAAVRALADDARTAVLRPLLVSGRGLRCSAEDAEALLAALEERAPDDLGGWGFELEKGGLARLHARGALWKPRLWVALATQIFEAGVTKALEDLR